MASLDDTRSELSSHDRILQAGRQLFAEDGYENTTTSAIARQAGTSESQLIKHFGSKEGLLEAILDKSWQRMSSSVRGIQEGPGSSLDRFRALIELFFVSMERDPVARTLLLLEGRRIRKHGHMVLLSQGFHQILGVIDGVLKQMRDEGILRADLHLEAVRSALLGAFEGLVRDQMLAERIAFPARYDGTELRAAFHAVLECFLVRQDG